MRNAHVISLSGCLANNMNECPYSQAAGQNMESLVEGTCYKFKPSDHKYYYCQPVTIFHTYRRGIVGRTNFVKVLRNDKSKKFECI